FGNKIAMPHPIEACAKRTVISVGILNQSILWGSGQAQLIFMLAVKKEDMKYLNSCYLRNDWRTQCAFQTEYPISIPKTEKRVLYCRQIWSAGFKC
ncbi:PTS sugar transporter subunit IIA, partial [Anaerostipes caccae]|uniref:PTS sugar transporter subunit IIA n=1 Tax=Anaerostipes caccae TaxID=105841 RepID=UPI002109FC2B